MHPPADPGAALADVARDVVDVLRRRAWRLVLVFVCIVAPLWMFGELAEEVRGHELIPFDEPILRLARSMARDGFDLVFLWLSKLGYGYFVVPFDIALVLGLALLRRHRESAFAGIALAGSALLNLGAKQSFARARPTLWESIAPESTFSFPSGHAMGSMTLACVAVALTWHTRWRWPVAALSAVFVVGVGLSRVYLGVHFPSDIVAGWAAASAWVMAVYLLAFRGELRPWRPRDR